MAFVLSLLPSQSLRGGTTKQSHPFPPSLRPFPPVIALLSYRHCEEARRSNLLRGHCEGGTTVAISPVHTVIARRHDEAIPPHCHCPSFLIVIARRHDEAICSMVIAPFPPVIAFPSHRSLRGGTTKQSLIPPLISIFHHQSLKATLVSKQPKIYLAYAPIIMAYAPLIMAYAPRYIAYALLIMAYAPI